MGRRRASVSSPNIDNAGRVTLGVASIRMGKHVDYFRTQRTRYRDHDAHPFPQPINSAAGIEEYDLVQLAVWDERRRQMPPKRKRTNITTTIEETNR